MLIDALNNFLEKKYKEQLFWIIFTLTAIFALILYFRFKNLIYESRAKISRLEQQKNNLFDELNKFRQASENISQTDDKLTQKLEYLNILKSEITDIQNSFAAKNRMLQYSAKSSEIYKLLSTFNDTSFILQNIDYSKADILNYISKETYNIKFYIHPLKLYDYLNNLENSKYYLVNDKMNVSLASSGADTNISSTLVSVNLTINYYKLAEQQYRPARQQHLPIGNITANFFDETAKQKLFADEKKEPEKPKPLKYPNFKIKGIIIKSDKKYIIVDNKLYGETDIIEDWKIKNILTNKLILEQNNNTIEYPIITK